MAIRSRQRSQAIVEFGLIALLFTALMFATVDFGLMLNTWQAVSSGTRNIARNASVGRKDVDLTGEASKLTMPGVDNGYGTPCPPCSPTSAIWLTVEYFDQCVPGPGCGPVQPGNKILIGYPGSDGTCTANPPPPAPPTCHPISNDSVRVTLVAQGAQVITPLLRPFFGCKDGVNPKCYVPLRSVAIMRFEGQEFP